MDRTKLSTLKWEMEIQRTGNPDLLSFGTADMDFRSPPAVIEALRAAVEAGHFGYPLKRPGYYDAVIGYLDRHFAWQVEKDWIESAVGVYPAMHPVITELTEPGDEIIYQPPVHHVFAEIVEANERVAVPNPLANRGGVYEMDFADLEAKITDRTRLLLLCSPHNPVGRVWTRGELQRLAEICARHAILVVADEVYCGLLREGVAFVPFATVSPWAATHCVSMLSPSKPFNLTGLKHAVVIAADPGLREAFRRGLLRTNLLYGGSLLGFVAAEAAFGGGDEWSRSLMRYVGANFAYLRARLEAHLPEVELTEPEATYFAWLNLRGLGVPRAVYQPLIENWAGLIVTYGEPMGIGGENHIRINLATPRRNLAAGIDRLLSVLGPLADRTRPPVRTGSAR